MSDKEFKIDKIRATQETKTLNADMSGPHTIFVTGTSKWSDFKDAKLRKVDWIMESKQEKQPHTE